MPGWLAAGGMETGGSLRCDLHLNVVYMSGVLPRLAAARQTAEALCNGRPVHSRLGAAD